ncbi:MAG: alpha/beta fold hydrolase [Eggerthellaceae bacterium]|jgi:acetyl esterase/lipase
MTCTREGITQVALEEIDKEYLCKTLDELPKSPMIPQHLLDAIAYKHLDLAYATQSSLQKLDLYLPPEANDASENTAPVPTVIFIHGGGFIAGDKRDMQASVYFGLLNHGYALASVNYRLAPAAHFPDPVKDCKAAVRYLRAHAREYNLDAGRFAVVGNSAGAYMALMIACSPNIGYLEDLSTGDSQYGTEVRCCVSTYAPTHFGILDAQKEQEGMEGPNADDPHVPECQFMGAPISSLSEELVAAASPASYLTRQVPPLMLQAGTADQLVPYTQTVYFANEAMQAAGEDKVNLKIVPGAGHHDPAFKRPAFLAQVLPFLDRYLK